MNEVLLTGGRPTGRLHLGHYTGAFKQFGELSGKYDSFCIISDLHMLTTSANHRAIGSVWENAKNMVVDVIGMGADILTTKFYLQSNIPEMPYLYTLLQNFVNVNDIQQTPSLVNTIEEMKRNASKSNVSLGLLAYPVMEAADIVGLQADIIPVGRDNIDHVKITHKIVDNINEELVGHKLKKPEWLTTKNNYISGIDGNNKMSKSLNNCIYISDTREEIISKIQSMSWDSNRNTIIQYIKIFALKAFESYQDYIENNESAAKEILTTELWSIIKNMQEIARPYKEEPQKVVQLLNEGTYIARERITKTLNELKQALGYDLRYCKW